MGKSFGVEVCVILPTYPAKKSRPGNGMFASARAGAKHLEGIRERVDVRRAPNGKPGFESRNDFRDDVKGRPTKIHAGAGAVIECILDGAREYSLEERNEFAPQYRAIGHCVGAGVLSGQDNSIHLRYLS